MAARFTRLRIAGFKSFAEPVELEILPGLTGIVGPNGCGKSNVAEALRWVMGESSARAMRGGEMDDVIFTGTAARASRNLAEATITLTATDPFPPPFQDATELQVSRRIERGSGSTYRVNGREARARDVQVLFADLASGARSSAMISQGRVGALVAARPDERRAVLDEAAGIGGLHTRRAEAEGKLRAAETNLDRAQERLDALHQQRATLDRQAQQAARYRILTTQITEGEAALSTCATPAPMRSTRGRCGRWPPPGRRWSRPGWQPTPRWPPRPVPRARCRRYAQERRTHATAPCKPA